MKHFRSFRWITSKDFDADTFLLDNEEWFVFVYLKNPNLNWLDVCMYEIEAKFDRGKLKLISGALKTKEKSNPLQAYLPSLIRKELSKVPESVVAYENGFRYRLETQDVLNPGLFLDQEKNRLKLIEFIEGRALDKKKVSSSKLLNLFSYTGSFSVVANCYGVETTSVDLSARYLEWEKKNHGLNQELKKVAWGNQYPKLKLIRSDAREFIEKAIKRGEKYTYIIIDPPTFSRSDKGVWKAEDHLYFLVDEAIRCLEPKSSVLLVSTNDSGWSHDDFYKQFENLAKLRNLKTVRGELPQEYSSLGEAYPLKSIWLYRN
jgi:23S rRNA (cytosine1962-C5)-methyltransferase